MKSVRDYKGISPQLGEGAYVDPFGVVIGDVVMGKDSSVWPAAVARGDMFKIVIGDRTNVQDGAVLHGTHAGPYNPDGWGVIIGDDVTVGHQAVVHGCTIGSRVLIGMGAVIMDGVVIEDEVIVAAGSVVPPGKRLESGMVYRGNPAKPGRELTDKEREFFLYSANNYVKLKDEYLAQL